MPVNNNQEMGKPVAIKDEGITLVPSVGSIDFTGNGVTSSAIGSDVSESIPGGGGGGLTKLTATGAINGSNTAFTFTSKPTYIVSDGAWLLENAGWTYSGSTATMTIPPQFSIWGFS